MPVARESITMMTGIWISIWTMSVDQRREKVLEVVRTNVCRTNVKEKPSFPSNKLPLAMILEWPSSTFWSLIRMCLKYSETQNLSACGQTTAYNKSVDSSSNPSRRTVFITKQQCFTIWSKRSLLNAWTGDSGTDQMSSVWRQDGQTGFGQNQCRQQLPNQPFADVEYLDSITPFRKITGRKRIYGCS